MNIWKNGNAAGITPANHFGGLTVLDVVPFKGSNFSVQVSKAPKGGGGEMHHHDDWSQVFFMISGNMTFDSGEGLFKLKPGEAVLFEPGDPHYTINEDDEEATYLVITVQQ